MHNRPQITFDHTILRLCDAPVSADRNFRKEIAPDRGPRLRPFTRWPLDSLHAARPSGKRFHASRELSLNETQFKATDTIPRLPIREQERIKALLPPGSSGCRWRSERGPLWRPIGSLNSRLFPPGKRGQGPTKVGQRLGLDAASAGRRSISRVDTNGPARMVPFQPPLTLPRYDRRQV